MGEGRAKRAGIAASTAVILALFVTVVVPLATSTSTASAYQSAPQCVAPNFVAQGDNCFVTDPAGVNAGCTVTNGQPTCPTGDAIYGRPPCRDGYVEIVSSNVCWPEPNTTPIPLAVAAACVPPNFVAQGTNCFVTDPAGADAGCTVIDNQPSCPIFCDYASSITGQCDQPTNPDPDPDCSYNASIVGCPQPVEVCGYASAITGECPQQTPPAEPSPSTPLFTVSSGPLTISTESSVAVVWQPTFVSVTGCTDGTATYAVLDDQGAVATSGQLDEDPAGTYSNSFQSLLSSGDYTIQTAITCPNSTVETESVAITYYDPSGQVRDCVGAPIVGATVTLTRADTAAGPFVPVPNGSTLMSPKNRLNPMPTDSNGLYGWDVADGFYVVVVDAGNYGMAQTEPLQVPPPRFNVNFDFACLPRDAIERRISSGGTADDYRDSSVAAVVDTSQTPVPTPTAGADAGVGAGAKQSISDSPGIAATGNDDDIWMIGMVLLAMGITTTGAARRRKQLTS